MNKISGSKIKKKKLIKTKNEKKKQIQEPKLKIFF